MSVSTRVSRKRTNGKVRLMIETGGYRHPGGTYEGEVDEANGLPDGTGSYYYKNGDEYHGQWRKSVREGHGEMKYANGDHFVGFFHQNAAIGHGCFTYVNGDVHTGHYKHGLMHGLGIIRYANGDIYEGKFRRGLKDDHEAKFTYSNGDVYCGRFRNNQPYENATLTMTFDDPTFEIDDDSSCDPYAISRAKPRKRAGQSEEERLKEEEEEAKKREPPKVVSVRHLFDGKMIEFDPETKTDNLAVLKAEHQHIDSSDSSEEETTDDDATQATAMSLSSYTGSATSATMTTLSEAKSRR